MKSRVLPKEMGTSFGNLYGEFCKNLEDYSGGAIVTFTGVVRRDEKLDSSGVKTTRIEIECVEGVSDASLQKIAKYIENRDGIVKVLIIHFSGIFELGDPMVHVFVCGAHRQEAFKALEDTVNLYKKEAPLWKKETFSDDSSEWIRHS
jgi:molybdopterin synthase catalytic subunit